MEAYIVSFYNIPFDLLSDKDNSVKRASNTAIDALFNLFPEDAKVSVVLPFLFKYLESSAKWQGKVGALKQVHKIIDEVPQLSLEHNFLQGIPIITNCMNDIKPELAKEGGKVLTAFAEKVDNHDIHPRIPAIVKTLADPKNVPECVKTFSQVTFVAEVTESALSILVPILWRALNQAAGSQELLRQTVIVVENLTRLVHNPLRSSLSFLTSCLVSRGLLNLHPSLKFENLPARPSMCWRRLKRTNLTIKLESLRKKLWNLYPNLLILLFANMSASLSRLTSTIVNSSVLPR